MRRVTTLASLTLLLLALAAPALAAEETSASGSFAGLGWAAIAGVVLGVLYFVLLPKDDAGSHDHQEHP